MKTEILLATLLLFTFSVSSVVATYHGPLEKEGPQTNFVVGFASDDSAKIDLLVGNRTGLNITYKDQYMFSPDGESRRIERKGDYIPLKEFSINISSTKPRKTVYEVPVTLRAYSDIDTGGSANPRLVNEREYVFKYRTQLSPDYGIEGGLINSSKAEKQGEEDTIEENTSENSIIDQNQTSTQVKEREKEPRSDTTLLLAAGVVLVFAYTLYEAMT